MKKVIDRFGVIWAGLPTFRSDVIKTTNRSKSQYFGHLKFETKCIKYNEVDLKNTWSFHTNEMTLEKMLFCSN